MNLHGIASAAISAINPMVPVIVRVSLGYTTQADGTQAPNYGPPTTIMGQVQSLTGGDLRHLDALNLQGNFNAIYLSGHVDGLIRAENKGGDMITMTDGTVWIVGTVLETWPDWCKLAVTLQNERQP